MPYYISDQQSDCAGWAALIAETPDADPRIIGCHQTKQDAIDQMVAASIADGIEPAGDWATRFIVAGNEPEMTDPVLDGMELDQMPDTESSLTPRQQVLYEGFEAVAEQFGLFDKGIGADGAHYVEQSPFTAEGVMCSNCAFFEGGRACEIVAGDIAPEAICKFWIIKEPLVIPEETNGDALLTVPDMISPENRWVIKTGDKRSVAFTNLELRAIDESSNDGWTVRGYAAVFDSPSEPLPWIEYVRKGAFTKTIKDGADVRLLIDHTGVPLARTKSGTLTLREDNRGLWMEAQLDSNNPDAVKLRSALIRGDISQMSFAFETIKDAWNTDMTVRELREVRLHDVSIVTYPAYEQTTAEIRNRQKNETPVVTVHPVSLRKAQVMLAKARAVK